MNSTKQITFFKKYFNKNYSKRQKIKIRMVLKKNCGIYYNLKVIKNKLNYI